jgi:hypothetical protein
VGGVHPGEQAPLRINHPGCCTAGDVDCGCEIQMLATSFKWEWDCRAVGVPRVVLSALAASFVLSAPSTAALKHARHVQDPLAAGAASQLNAAYSIHHLFSNVTPLNMYLCNSTGAALCAISGM